MCDSHTRTESDCMLAYNKVGYYKNKGLVSVGEDECGDGRVSVGPS